MEIQSRPSRCKGFPVAATGAMISVLAMVTYFLVVPRWQDLRDSGVPSVILALAGVVVSLEGLRRASVSRRRRRGSAIFFALGAFSAAFLAIYIFLLSYQLPPSDGVVRVGEKAPSFQLSDQNDRKRTLQEFRGRPLFLVFFRGHW